MQNTGINVQLMGKELMHLRLQPGFVVEDELAIHMTYMSMGVNGLKSCILCYNNFNGIQGKGCMGGDAEGRGCGGKGNQHLIR